MNLRPHQERAIEMLRHSLAKGYKRPVLAACCSFGKTITALYILTEAAKKGKKGIFFCDRVKLVQQALAAFDREGVDVGVIQSMHERTNREAMIQIASIQSVARMQRKPEFDLAVVDECFIGSTLVDGKRIDSLKVGDSVMSYNHRTNKIENKKVLRVMKKKSKDICAIKSYNGYVYCTPNHKFWDGKKYEEIRNIKGDIYGLENTGNRFGETFKKMVLPMLDLQRLVYTILKPNRSIQQWENIAGMPQRRMQGSQEKNKQSKIIRKNEGLFEKWRSTKDDYKQPIQKPASKKENIKHTESNGSQTTSAGWEWQRVNHNTKNVIGLPWRWLGVGIYTENWRISLSESLQNRFSERRTYDCSGGGWLFSLLTRKTKTRQEENRAIRKARMESYQILEQRDTERLGLLQDENNQYDVWDIEVEDNHNFFANGYLVHNCHTHYKTTQELMDRYSNVPFIGLSATPYSKGLGLAYNDLVVPVTMRQLLDKGYLCPVKYYGGATADTKGLKTKKLSTGANDYDPKELNKAIEKDSEYLTGDIIKNYVKLAYNRPAIAFSPSVKHSKYLVEQFNKAGIPAVHIDGYMEQDERQAIFDGHENGEFKILSCSMLLGTGYDAPHISCLIDCYPTQSKIQFIQRAGRIARLHNSKTESIYLDHAGNIARHGFPEDIVPDSLDDGEKPYNENNQVKEKKEPKTRDCPQCFGIMVGIRCACGYEIPIMEQIKTTEEELTLLKKPTDYQDDHKAVFLGGLELYANQKGYKSGWVAHSYKKKFGAFPDVKSAEVKSIHPIVKGFVKHLAIRKAKGVKYAR